jgi:hypothetical protein
MNLGIISFLDKCEDQKVLEEIICHAEEKLNALKDIQFKKELQEKFPTIILNDVRKRGDEITIDFALHEDGPVFHFKVEYIDSSDINRSSRDFVLYASIDKIGSLRIDADDYSSHINFGPNFRDLVPKEKEEIFDEFVLSLLKRYYTFFETNPFSCNDETLEFIQKGYKLANEYGLIIKYLDKQKCKFRKVSENRFLEVDFADFKCRPGLEGNTEFIKKLIDMR